MKRTVLLLIALLLVQIAIAQDEQFGLSPGDAQTCFGNDFECVNLADAQPQGVAAVTGNITVVEQYYTTNDLVNLSLGVLNNTGDLAIGTLALTVEYNTSGTWLQVATVLNDSLNYTIPTAASLDVAALWNAASWNSTLAGAGLYRARVRYFDPENGLLADTTATFHIVDALFGPVILSPANNSISNSRRVNVTYNASGYRNATSCDLLVDGQLVNTSTGHYANTSAFTTAGPHNFSISCTDAQSHSYSSPAYRIKVIPLDGFGGTTTNISGQDIENISNLTLEKPSVGKIQFTESVNLSDAPDISSYVTISHNLVSVNSAAIGALNKSAVLTLENITGISYPVVLRDGVVCEECTISSFSGGTVEFVVPHFSSYVIGSNARLDVADTSETQQVPPFVNSTIVANYTNITSGLPIAGAVCNITFNDSGPDPMGYDGQSYLYNRSFNDSGVYFYTVNCSAAGYEPLSTGDYVSITQADGPSGAIINVTETSRSNVSLAPQGTDAQGGNTTELNIEAFEITKTWQGVYGNVSGEVILSTANQTKFYNWSVLGVSGEVYASRAPDVNFATVGCGDDNHIATEDQTLGTLSDESVNNTFNQTNHPGFLTGNVNHAPNSCRSTNIHGADGQNLSQYYEVLLVDGANNTVYTSILQANTVGFNGRENDFEMMVPAQHNVVETYYYWIEIT